MSGKETHLYEFGPFRLDPAKRRLLRDGDLIPLTPKAFDTLLVLVQQSGTTIEKDDLMERVWPDAVVEENNLNQNISALRKSLGDSRHESHYIATIPGLGYRFVADVREVDAVAISAVDVKVQTTSRIAAVEDSVARTAETLAATPPASAPFPPPSSILPAPASKIARPRRPLRLALFIAVPLLLAAAVYFLFIRQRGTPVQPSISSIAVLPLENLSGDPAQEYFADGMTDALIGDLAKIEKLRVISRTSSMHYKGTKKSLPEIAGELNVDAVVEGTVQRSAERVRIRVQLIHAATDRHLWVQTYERDVGDVLDLQSEIASAIATAVQFKTTTTEQLRANNRKPVNPKAYDDYLQGRYLYWNKRTEENVQKALEFFQSAVKHDPGYALAYVGLADCYNSMGSVQVSALVPIEARRLAEEAAVKGLELDPNLAEAHTSLGYVRHYNWDWKAAEQEYERAIKLNPNYAHAHNYYASYLMSRGRAEESLAASNRARELDPFSLAISVQRGFLLENARRFDEAIVQLNSVIAMDPNHFQAYFFLGHIYALNKQFDEAIAASEKAVLLSGRAPGALGMLGLTYGLAGRKSEATRVLKELLAVSERRYVTPVALAFVYIGLGEKDQAFVWLEKAFQERSHYLVYLNTNPIADPLRSDPRFAELLRRISLPE